MRERERERDRLINNYIDTLMNANPSVLIDPGIDRGGAWKEKGERGERTGGKEKARYCRGLRTPIRAQQ